MTHLNYYLKREAICHSQYHKNTVYSMCRKQFYFLCKHTTSVLNTLIEWNLNLYSMKSNIIAGDTISECGTSYYSEYDPFDYLYSSGTQYSDPLYEAVIKIDRTPASMTNNELYVSANSIKKSFDFSQVAEQLERSAFSLTDWDDPNDELSDFMRIEPTTSAPPLPPRNAARQSSFSEPNRSAINRTNNKASVDRLKIATKLYENVIENRTYDAELLAFYNMVSTNRNQIRNFKFNSIQIEMNVDVMIAGETCTI